MSWECGEMRLLEPEVLGAAAEHRLHLRLCIPVPPQQEQASPRPFVSLGRRLDLLFVFLCLKT